MDLKTLSAEKLVTLLNEETLELIIKAYLNNHKDVISWLRYIDNVFDNISNDGYALSDNYTTVLHELADLFPQFVSECKYDNQKYYKYLDDKIKDDNHIYINGAKHRVIFKRNDKYYAICTYEISDPITNYKILEFLNNKKIPIIVGLCIGEEDDDSQTE